MLHGWRLIESPAVRMLFSVNASFLLNQQEKLPAVAAGAYLDSERTWHSWAQRDHDDINGTQINEYNILEYNHLIDVKTGCFSNSLCI